MSAFKDRPKRDQKKADEFAEGADVSTNTKNVSQEDKKEQTQEPFYTTLQPRFKELIQAVAYYDRKSQREVVEQALEAYYSGKEGELQKALDAYHQKEQ